MPKRKPKTAITGSSTAGTVKRQLKQEGGGRKALRTARAMSKGTRTAMKARAKSRGTTLTQELKDVRTKRQAAGKRGVSGKTPTKVKERIAISLKSGKRELGRQRRQATPKTSGGGGGTAGGGTQPISNVLSDPKARAKLRETYGEASKNIRGKNRPAKPKTKVAKSVAGTAFKSKAAQAEARAGMAATDRARRYQSRFGGTLAQARSKTAQPGFVLSGPEKSTSKARAAERRAGARSQNKAARVAAAKKAKAKRAKRRGKK